MPKQPSPQSARHSSELWYLSALVTPTLVESQHKFGVELSELDRGCRTHSNGREGNIGAAVGVAAGAKAGAVVGAAVGAVVGAAVGAVVGAAVGAAVTKSVGGGATATTVTGGIAMKHFVFRHLDVVTTGNV